ILVKQFRHPHIPEQRAVIKNGHKLSAPPAAPQHFRSRDVATIQALVIPAETADVEPVYDRVVLRQQRRIKFYSHHVGSNPIGKQAAQAKQLSRKAGLANAEVEYKRSPTVGRTVYKQMLRPQAHRHARAAQDDDEGATVRAFRETSAQAGK